MRLCLALVAASLAFSPAAFADSVGPAMDPACQVAGAPVDQAGFVTIGGIQQWVMVEGESCGNPVVLIVHGGPGNPNTPFAHEMFAGWAQDFTVVNWDQRGSGKTYAANAPAEDEALTLEQLTRDGVEIARYAADRFGKRKVILMGGSWGSALATGMALAQPDLFHAYVGTAQLASYVRDTEVGYRQALAHARATGAADDIARLEGIGPPPWTNPRAFGILRRITRRYEAAATDPAPENWFVFRGEFDTPAYREAYEGGEDYSFFQFVGPAGDGIGPSIDLFATGMTFAMPVTLIQGEEDLVTPAEVSRAYFERIAAPSKEFVLLPRTGHDPNLAMIDAQLAALHRLRPAAAAADLRSRDAGIAARARQ